MVSQQHNVGMSRVWFAEDARDGASELFVETPDRLGILFAVVTAIIGARVRIVRSEANIANGVAHDWFLLAEPNGGPIEASHREQVRAQVLAAIDTWQQRGAA